MKRRRELTGKQKAFADGYRKHGKATIAAVEAGYSPAAAHATARALLKNKAVGNYLELSSNPVAAFDRARVIAGLLAIAESKSIDVRAADKVKAWTVLTKLLAPAYTPPADLPAPAVAKIAKLEKIDKKAEPPAEAPPIAGSLEAFLSDGAKH